MKNEKYKNTLTSMNIHDALFMYLNAAEIAKKHRESKERIRVDI
jgi:hypothetical protein